MTIIVLLILTGLLLLVLEFFVFPGITISGIGGFLTISLGVYIAYSGFGKPTGNIVLVLTILATIVVFAMAFRGKTWNKLMLNTQITGSIETVSEDNIKEGDKGITTTRLNPIGRARINEEEVEARCPGKFVEPKTEIEVVKVFKTHVIVKPVM
jgi:membrane-bound ClpP family serine protease